MSVQWDHKPISQPLDYARLLERKCARDLRTPVALGIFIFTCVVITTAWIWSLR